MRGGRRRWIMAAGGLILAMPAILWMCLPVESSPTPIRLSARPAGFFSTMFHCELRNASSTPQELRDFTVRTAGDTDTLVDEPGPPRSLSPGEAMTKSFLPEYVYGMADRGPGLHRVTIARSCTGREDAATTDVWILNIGGKIFAVK